MMTQNLNAVSLALPVEKPGILRHIPSVPIEVGYEFSVYTTTEGTGVVTLCAVVMNFPGGSPRPFTINAATEDGSGGMIHLCTT